MARAVTVTTSGPFFDPNLKGRLEDGVAKGLIPIGDAMVSEVQRRMKPGKGVRTGGLRQSFGNSSRTGQLTAVVRGTNQSVADYYHRVEYGSRYMKGQHQRKNARRQIIRALNNPYGKSHQRIVQGVLEKLG